MNGGGPGLRGKGNANAAKWRRAECKRGEKQPRERGELRDYEWKHGKRQNWERKDGKVEMLVEGKEMGR